MIQRFLTALALLAFISAPVSAADLSKVDRSIAKEPSYSSKPKYAWKEGHVAPSHHEIPVVAPRSTIKLEPVSSRLKGELIHPNRSGSISKIHFSPDGNRLIAGDYPGGVVVVWDAETGKQLAAIESGYGYRGTSEYFFVSPDWKTLYVSREKRKRNRVEKDGKGLVQWEFEGDVRAWDLGSGELRDTFKHTPPRGMGEMLLSPDGSTIVTFEELPGETEVQAGPKIFASLWDVKTRQCRPLGENLEYWSVYSPDSKILAAPAGGRVSAIKVFDVATAKEKFTIPIVGKDCGLGYIASSPDGKQIVGQVRDEGKGGRHWLKFWDAATGRETASFEGDPKDVFLLMTFSPDGRYLAVTNAKGPKSKLFFFDSIGKKLVKTITLEETTEDERWGRSSPVFSPDGKWLALTTQRMPKNARGELDAHNLPQPRIHLINMADNEIRETLIAPQALSWSACFSPDGRTLATGGLGRVLLWDMTKLPGQSAVRE
jgi:WD40 repeat protein